MRNLWRGVRAEGAADLLLGGLPPAVTIQEIPACERSQAQSGKYGEISEIPGEKSRKYLILNVRGQFNDRGEYPRNRLFQEPQSCLSVVNTRPPKASALTHRSIAPCIALVTATKPAGCEATIFQIPNFARGSINCPGPKVLRRSKMK